MAVPATPQPGQGNITVNFTPGTGLVFPKAQTVLAVPQTTVPNPPILIGIDAVPFSTTDLPNIKGFPNLPVRTTSNNPLNPLKPTAQKIVVLPSSILIFTAYVMNGVPIKITPIAYTDKNVACIGPFLGPGTYTQFKVQFDTAIPSSGIIVGTLTLQRG